MINQSDYNTSFKRSMFYPLNHEQPLTTDRRPSLPYITPEDKFRHFLPNESGGLEPTELLAARINGSNRSHVRALGTLSAVEP